MSHKQINNDIFNTYTNQLIKESRANPNEFQKQQLPILIWSNYDRSEITYHIAYGDIKTQQRFFSDIPIKYISFSEYGIRVDQGTDAGISLVKDNASLSKLIRSEFIDNGVSGDYTQMSELLSKITRIINSGKCAYVNIDPDTNQFTVGVSQE